MGKGPGRNPGPLFTSKFSFTTEWEGEGRYRGEGIGKGISRQYLDQVFKEYGPKVGIPGDLCHFHTLKHSICVYLLDRGYSLEEVADWVGHKSIRTTQIYAKVSEKKYEMMVKRLDREIGDEG